ncbi:hypothetical protein B296_00056203 [Ensete ventricosum]|uniref:Uncharacterized protein n=1 Tax=Ensete ventricosum TaxID=4639 RepID=A0A426X3M9_ENSVE|nr:hypothetical protein B296_00056203 [Ensete ventricosum]
METELPKLTRSKDALRPDLSRQAIEDYNKSFEFEMGLVRMGRVSLEYGYQLALARLRARHPGVEIEEDPFALLPEDVDVPMADEQPFDDSPPGVARGGACRRVGRPLAEWLPTGRGSNDSAVMVKEG